MRALKPALAGMLVLLLGLAAYRGLARRPERGAIELPPNQPVFSARTEPSPPPAAPIAPRPAETAGPRRAQRAPPGPEQWTAFRDRFGGGLTPTYAADGRLLSVRGRVGVGARTESKFQPTDPQAAIARAREILEAARDLLEVESDYPLGEPQARGSDLSVQVAFAETHDGRVIAPYGSVSVLLGADGELLRLESSYVPGPDLVNRPSLGPEQARRVAFGPAPPTGEPGRPLLWVTRDEGGPRGYYAFEFRSQGRQVIVDAADGHVLFRKDLQQY